MRRKKKQNIHIICDFVLYFYIVCIPYTRESWTSLRYRARASLNKENNK